MEESEDRKYIVDLEMQLGTMLYLTDLSFPAASIYHFKLSLYSFIHIQRAPLSH